ncbi:hypothetical protein [Parasphingorhabdus litoris]|nr:hypothetical protein [Parasphingorhabdus litoris]
MITKMIIEEQRAAIGWGELRGLGYSSDTVDCTDAELRPGPLDAISLTVDDGQVMGLEYDSTRFRKTTPK